MYVASNLSPGIPTRAGIGLRGPHVAEILASRPALGWFEVHPENYMGNGPALARLQAIRRDYPLSLHGVGLSLGSADGIDLQHLARLKELAERLEPGLISEHVAWSVSGSTYVNDLLPLPYTEESLGILCRNVMQVQETLGCRILMENPSAYLRFRYSPIPEPEFLAELSHVTGCGLLCDVNNIYVSCQNFGLDPFSYLNAFPAEEVGEIHIAGHHATERGGKVVFIDEHGSRAVPAVWELYRHALSRFGRVPTLVEWDKDIPEMAVLMDEARIADAYARELES
ncbi:MAG: DUF692 domain-containing protein [Acetobacteraceae bacterium]|nr:DUF692 domain-containing protein [Acetobacteraceae bacterium]